MEIEAAATDRSKPSNWGAAAAAAETDRDVPYTGLDRGSFLAWQDLRVVLPNFGKGPTKRLLNGLNGYAEPGRIMAIMGPSGSGKSTLLDSLAGSCISISCHTFFSCANIMCSIAWSPSLFLKTIFYQF